jgi:trigger factor
MSYTIDTVNDHTKKLVFNFETVDLSSQIKDALNKKRKDVSLKGFRKGKAPIAMVEKLYRPQIENEALGQFVQTELYNAIKEEKLNVVGYPSFENVKYEEENNVSFEAVVEVFPEIEMKDISHLSFSSDKVEIDSEEVDKTIKGYLAQKAEMKEVEDASATLETGKHAVFNFEGIMPDGERPENMKGSDYPLEIGSGQFIPGFEEQMIGMKKSEKKNLNVTFPADYHVDELKSAEVVFEVELLEIKEQVFPEMTDELAKEFGFESIDDMDTKTKENLSTQKERQQTEKLHGEILDELINTMSFEVPAAMIANQKDYLKKDLESNLARQGFNDQMKEEYFEKWEDDLNQKAAHQVKSGLILEEFAKKYNIEVTEADVDAKLAKMAEESKMELDKIKEYYTGDMKKNLQYALREEKTFAKIKEEVTVIIA